MIEPAWDERESDRPGDRGDVRAAVEFGASPRSIRGEARIAEKVDGAMAWSTNG